MDWDGSGGGGEVAKAMEQHFDPRRAGGGGTAKEIDREEVGDGARQALTLNWLKMTRAKRKIERNGVDENGLRQCFGARCRLLSRGEKRTTGICPAISGTTAYSLC